MISEFISTLLQVLVFTLIPFLFYLFKYRSVKGFFKFIGLKRSTKRANSLAVLASLLFAAPMFILIFTSEEIKEIMFNPNSMTGKFKAMGIGVESLVILFVSAVFKTSFAEEVLFRGFVAKRLISVLGYQKGNILQAIIFGAIHTALFAIFTTNILFLSIIFIIPSIGAYVSAYLNEKLANGSIIPGWISHGLANILSYSIVGFMI